MFELYTAVSLCLFREKVYVAKHTSAEIFQLSVSERIQLVEDLWDSIAVDSASVPLKFKAARGVGGVRC